MYGSNWPVSDKLSSYETVFTVVQRYVDEKAGIDADKFFRINSRTCYRWVDRG